VRCDQLADVLPELATDATHLDPAERRHVEHCLRCQAELVQYRKLLRAMRAMRTDVLEPAPGLLADVLAGLEEAGERHAIRGILTGRRVVYLGGLAAATAAAGVGSALIVARRRRVAA
jgi:hypothetical protein